MEINAHFCVNHYIIALLTCLIFFTFPFQIFIIGTDTGIGIQGAVYRYQITTYGNSLIPLTKEIMYIINGVYGWKTSLSVIVWALGTLLLAITTVFALIYASVERSDYSSQIFLGIIGSCACYLISIILQYGILFFGPAGISIPAGIFLLLIWILILFKKPEIFDFLEK